MLGLHWGDPAPLSGPPRCQAGQDISTGWANELGGGQLTHDPSSCLGHQQGLVLWPLPNSQLLGPRMGKLRCSSLQRVSQGQWAAG